MKFAQASEKDVDIKGSSKDVEHPGWVEIESFSWGFSRPFAQGRPMGGSRDGSAAVPVELVFASTDGAAVAKIFQACARGISYGSVTLQSTSEGHVVLRVDMKDVMIPSCQMGGNRGDATPSILFSLSAKKIEISRVTASADLAPKPGAPQPPPKKK